MGDYLIFILVIAAVVGFIIWRVTAKKKRVDKRNLDMLPITVPKDFPHKYNTEDLSMPYIASVVPVPQAALDAIYEGLNMTLRSTAAKFPHWNKIRSLGEFNIMLIDPEATNRENTPGSPALIYKQKNAEGEITNRIQTAGTVIGVGWDKISPTNIVLPHQANHDNWGYLEYLRDSARNEAEHYCELFNDMQMFNSYATSGDVHPHHLLPEEESFRPVGFAAIRSSKAQTCVTSSSVSQPQEGRGYYKWMDDDLDNS